MQIDTQESFSVADIVLFLKRHTKTILTAGFITASCAAIISLLMQPVYRSTATILIDTPQSNIMEAAALFSVLSPDSSVVDSQVEIIRSPRLLARVAEKERLYKRQDFYNPTQSIPSVLGVLFGIHPPLGIDPALEEAPSFFIDWLRMIVPAPEPHDFEVIKTRVIELLQEDLYVRRQGKSLVLSISFDAYDAILAEKIVNRIVKEYLNDQLESKLESTKRATSWLTERLAGLRQELDAKEAQIALFKRDNNLFGANGVTQIERQVTRLNEQLVAAKVETAEKLARYNQVRILSKQGSLQSYSGFVASGTVSNLRNSESDAIGDVANLSAKYGENHPQLINAKAKLRDIRKQISQEANRMIANARSEYQIANSREASLRNNLNKLKNEFDAVGTKSIRLQQLEREAETARTAYNTISERFRETDKSDKIQESDARIISEASKPLDPVRPQKTLLTIIGFIVGCFIGAMIAMLREALIKGYIRAEDLQKDTGLNVLSSIMHLSADELSGKTVHEYMHKKPLSAFSESIRRIRVSIEANENLKKITSPNLTDNNIVMVTSSVPSEGKTTIASCYALSAAISGKKVILIDTDFRRPALSKMIHKDICAGLTEYLSGKVTKQEIIHKTNFERLDMIGIKDCPNNPTDLLKSDTAFGLLQSLSKEYDLVLLDTPPLSAVVDGRVLADYVHDIVYVSAWESTPRQIINQALNSLPNGLKNKVAGFILNKIDVTKDLHYGDEYGYGYSMQKYAGYYESA